MLASWDGAMLKVRSQEQEHLVFRNKILYLVSERGNWRDFFDKALGEEYDIKPSNIHVSNLPILQSSEFENYIVTVYATAKLLNNLYYNELKERIIKTLALIKIEMEQ